MTVLVCGRGRVAVDVLQHAAALRAAGAVPARLLACPSDGDAGVDTWQPSLVGAARALGVPVVGPAEVRSDPDLVLLSLEYDRILDVGLFASRRLYNVHFSALPAYRGVYTSIWPILNGEAEAGVTLHEVDAGVDTGPVVAQRRFGLDGAETARSLFARFHAEAARLVAEWYPRLVGGAVRSEPQGGAGASLYRRADLDVERERALTLDRSAAELDRRTRAFYFPEYQTATFGGRAVRACRPTGVPAGSARPGAVVADTGRSAVAVTAGREVVELVWA